MNSFSLSHLQAALNAEVLRVQDCLSAEQGRLEIAGIRVSVKLTKDLREGYDDHYELADLNSDEHTNNWEEITFSIPIQNPPLKEQDNEH